MSNRLGTWLGVVTVGLTVFGSVAGTFAPAVYRYPPPTTVPVGSASISSVGVPPELVVFVAAMIAAALTLLVGAYLRGGVTGSVPLAWAGAVILIVGAAVTVPGESTLVVPGSLAADIPDSVGIGAYFVPAALCALLTAIVNSAASRAAVGRPSWS